MKSCNSSLNKTIPSENLERETKNAARCLECYAANSARRFNVRPLDANMGPKLSSITLKTIPEPRRALVAPGLVHLFTDAFDFPELHQTSLERNHHSPANEFLFFLFWQLHP